VEGRTGLLRSRWHGSGETGSGVLRRFGALRVPFTLCRTWDYRIEWIIAKGAAAICGSSPH